VAAVALSTTVVLFAVNVTSNQVQKENLQITDVTLNTSNCTVTIQNTGATSIRVSQITIKGDKYSNYTSTPDISEGLAKGNYASLTVTLNNGTVTKNDIGRPSTLVILTTQGSYFTETLVQATSNTG
jgi:archaellum component FlaF (FlaF/FlaG flagellin family)